MWTAGAPWCGLLEHHGVECFYTMVHWWPAQRRGGGALAMPRAFHGSQPPCAAIAPYDPRSLYYRLQLTPALTACPAMALGKSRVAKVNIGWACMIVGGIGAFVIARNSVTAKRQESMRTKQRLIQEVEKEAVEK